MLEEKVFEFSRLVSWHKEQMLLARQHKHLWKCVLACAGSCEVDEGGNVDTTPTSGAILLEIGDLIRQVELDPKFKIRTRGEIRCVATASFDKKGKRKTDWDFDLTAPTTVFSLDEDYKYESLKHPLYIPDLQLDTVDQICDAELDSTERDPSNEGRVTFCLPCVLVQLDPIQVELDLNHSRTEKTTIMSSMKTMFQSNLDKIQTL